MGFGTSLVAKMNVEKALSKLGIRGVSVEHSSVSEAVGCNYDLFIVSRDLETQVKSKPNVVVLDSIVNVAELETKLKAVFEQEA
jgi:PTS system ascorbate-specific IIB component